MGSVCNVKKHHGAFIHAPLSFPRLTILVWEQVSHNCAPFLHPLSCPQLPTHLQKYREEVCTP